MHSDAQAHALDQSYYKPLQPGETDLHVNASECEFLLTIIPIHLFGNIVVVGEDLEYSQDEAVALSDVLTAQNEYRQPSFVPKQLKKTPLLGFSSLVWKSNKKASAAQVREDLRSYPQLKDFYITISDPRPMDLIATDSNILNLVAELKSQGRRVPSDSMLFSGDRTMEQVEHEHQTAMEYSI
jgi:hypothetical protein